MNINQKTCALILLPLMLLGIGCIQRSKTVVKDTFLLSARRSGPPVQAINGPILAVQPFSIAPAFAGKDLVRQIGPNRYESDYYTEYFVSPSRMMTDRTRNWIANSGLFEAVLPPSSSVQPAMVLEAHIEQMLADMQNPTNSQAKLEMTFVIIKRDKHQDAIHFQKTYAKAHPMAGPFWQDYITAQDVCLTQILTELEKDLAASLENQ